MLQEGLKVISNIIWPRLDIFGKGNTFSTSSRFTSHTSSTFGYVKIIFLPLEFFTFLTNFTIGMLFFIHKIRPKKCFNFFFVANFTTTQSSSFKSSLLVKQLISLIPNGAVMFSGSLFSLSSISCQHVDRYSSNVPYSELSVSAILRISDSELVSQYLDLNFFRFTTLFFFPVVTAFCFLLFFSYDAFTV